VNTKNDAVQGGVPVFVAWCVCDLEGKSVFLCGRLGV